MTDVPLLPPPTSVPTEWSEVERPMLEQLGAMGWQIAVRDKLEPASTFRESFREVLLLRDLREALHRINLNDEGQPWLDDGRIDQAVSALERPGGVKLLEVNQAATERLLIGAEVEGVPGWDQGRVRTVRYIDWEEPRNNTFRAISQFRVDEPGGQAHHFIVADIVLFVNGIPLVVIECKSPGVTDPMEQAIDQLQRYSNQRSWVEENEGNERFFHANQILVPTCMDEARSGTVGAQAHHFVQWKDTVPLSLETVAESVGKKTLADQEILTAGMLRPENLLDIVRHFVLFKSDAGRTRKIVCRYQQYRAVLAAVERLKTGESREKDGEHDRRGGIVWHTQGSGKSLTMVFLVRKMRSDPELRRFKVVVVTDRMDLQDQLSRTADLTGEVVRVARSTAELKALLAEKGPGLVFATIQKYKEREGDEPQRKAALPEAAEPPDTWEKGIDPDGEEAFPVLNEDESILVLVDEAHRSHGSALHANLLRALPNCARIGFTGTPILMGDKKRTHEIFGDYLDRYTIHQSEEDGATVPILYEGRTAEGTVKDGRRLDDVFVDCFREWSDEEREIIQQRYATKGHVMEAEELIEAKARDMLRHYVEAILPNGFKAQVVSVSRRAAIRYRDALMTARDEMVSRIEALDEGLLQLEGDALEERDPEVRFLVRARPYLPALKKLEFAPVVSGGHNDPPSWAEWTDRNRQTSRIERFKKDLFHEDPTKRDLLAFLIVKSMLLTGFDAPVEQALYLDRPIRQHELLQAIARVNRTYGKKEAGIVVDYYGVANHLKEALKVYSEEDVEGTFNNLMDEIPKLRDRHRRVLAFFANHGIDNISDIEACVDLLEDEKLRAEFQVLLKEFLKTLDLILPRPEGLPYVKDAKILGHIQIRVRNRYRPPGVRPIGREVGEKVRRLIDDHIVSLGIDPKIPPVSLTDDEFDREMDKAGSPRAKASEMEHALRYHIRQHFNEDPEHYEKLSERLKRILEELEGQWEEMVEALRKEIEKVRAGRQQDETGLDPVTQAPFLGVLKQELGREGSVSKERLVTLSRLTIDLVYEIRGEIGAVDFWGNTHAQKALKKRIVQRLDDEDLMPFERLSEVASRLVELARVNHEKLIR